MPIPLPVTIALLMLVAACLGLATYWGVVLWHIARTMRRVPMCRDGLRLGRAAGLLRADGPRVCVIVPAHNEQGVVGKLAASLTRQTYPNLSVVFALDRCTDGTAEEIRRESGGADHVEIIEVRECPADWAGKVNAVHTAVRQSRAARNADLLLFTDADTEFDPECVRAAVALLLEPRAGDAELDEHADVRPVVRADRATGGGDGTAAPVPAGAGERAGAPAGVRERAVHAVHESGV